MTPIRLPSAYRRVRRGRERDGHVRRCAPHRSAERSAPACRHLVPLASSSGDGGRLYHRSHALLLAHEDKRYPGAMIASLSIPSGEVKGDEDQGGYHRVWTRDMVNSATGLLASGNTETRTRS
jgi:glucoamylase